MPVSSLDLADQLVFFQHLARVGSQAVNGTVIPDPRCLLLSHRTRMHRLALSCPLVNLTPQLLFIAASSR